MSSELISHNPDIKRLLDEGYEVDLFGPYLLISHVPYVNAGKQVAFGTFISKHQKIENSVLKPDDHQVLWVGDHPCKSDGSKYDALRGNQVQEKIRDDLVASFSFSRKLVEGGNPRGYKDYHEKMTQYVAILENEAHTIDPNATARTFRPIPASEEDSVFYYWDTASSRAGIKAINEKLKQPRIAIVGLGGTGSYVLDLVAKTEVKEIHLYDGDDFFTHNAFRAPGAPSFEELCEKTKKADRFAQIYSKMRRKIISHPFHIDKTNITDLQGMNFVFLCVDEGEPKMMMVNYLVESKIPFIDVGMGLSVKNDSLVGLVRVTACRPSFNSHISKRISFGQGGNNEYATNIQIADMNALNAALAVIKWKKIQGFYHDFGHEHYAGYEIDTNTMVNEDIEAQDA